MTRLRDIRWTEKSKIIEQLLNEDDTLEEIPLDAGMEAEVIRFSSPEMSVVLKIWNKGAVPDVQFQYDVLQALKHKGISVSEPLGWGIDGQSNQVLLTSYGGKPMDVVDREKISELAKLLAGIHLFPADGIAFPSFDFISYFFPAIDKHPDLHEEVQRLFRMADYCSDHVIHGDYHIRNVLVNGGKYTVIDWTNVQMGDPRYDVANAAFLTRIYVGERDYEAFLTAYRENGPSLAMDLEVFEAIACLRWLLLHRMGGLPMFEDTISRVNEVLRNDRYLAGKFMLAE